MFTETFQAFTRAFASMDKEMTSTFKELHRDAETTITNNNGHIVITGKVRSLRVNDHLIELIDAPSRQP